MNYKELAEEWLGDVTEYRWDRLSIARRTAIRNFASWLDSPSPTPIGAAADTCPACKGSGKGRYPGQICCGTCDGDGQV